MRVHSATVISQARNDGAFSPSILLLIKSSFKLLSNTYKSARVMRALRPSTKSPRGSIVPGGVYAGHGIPPSVQTLVAVSVPLVSGPPGNPEGFQAHAGFPLRIKNPQGFLMP